MMRIPCCCFLIITLFLAACGSSKKASSSGSEPAARFLPPLPASQINIPVRIHMRQLLARMDSSTAKEFTSAQWPDYTYSACDYRYKYRFVRSPFSFSCVNNKVNISFRGNYQISGSKCICVLGKQVSPWVNGSCGFGSEPLRRVDVNISSQLELLPDHRLRTTTLLEKSNAIDKCQVTVMQTDMTAQVLDSIRASVETYTTAFDQFVQALNENSILQQWRKTGSPVMPVSRYGYLNLNPELLRITKFNLYRDSLMFTIGYTGSPRFSSDSNRLVNKTKLPLISSDETAGGISTYLDAVYDYGFFNKLLNDSLRNKAFTLEGRTFVIKDVRISGDNFGKIYVDLSFTGFKSGALHLSGTPVLDSSRQVLSMPDINYTLESRDMLLNMAKGMMRKKVMKQLQNQSVLDITALIQKNKPAIEARMSQIIGSWLKTQGKLDDIKLVGILPQKDYLQVQAFIKASITITGNPPPAVLNGL